MFIGDGAKLVRDAFALAKEKGPTIIFIDELDAIGRERERRGSGEEKRRERKGAVWERRGHMWRIGEKTWEGRIENNKLISNLGTKRFDSELSGDREVQRTMLELLNQLDGFSSTSDIKVIAATNRIDILPSYIIIL